MPESTPATGTSTGMEIERKFLLRVAPPPATLAGRGARVMRIEQVYLSGPPGGRRIRRLEHADGTAEFRLTRKEHVRAFTFHEEEAAIDASRYAGLLLEADPGRRPIRKTRFAVPHGTQVLEIDVFEEPPGLVLLEVELATEEEPVRLPGWVGEWREVTGDARYLNANLARPETSAPTW